MQGWQVVCLVIAAVILVPMRYKYVQVLRGRF